MGNGGDNDVGVEKDLHTVSYIFAHVTHFLDRIDVQFHGTRKSVAEWLVSLSTFLSEQFREVVQR